MGLNGLLCHSVVAALANNFLLVGENVVTKNLNYLLRCSLHVLIASVLFYRELPKFKDTYFSYLGLPMTATHNDVLKSYEDIQEHLNTAAPEVVERIKRAYEVLANQETRILYSLYGDVGIAAKTSQDFTIILITVAFSFYALSTIVCCAFNRSNRLRFARYGCFLYNALAFFIEIELRFYYSTFMSNLFYLKTLLPYQHIEFLRAMAPFVMMAVSFITHFFAVDYDKLNLFLWQSTVATNTVIMEKMSKVLNSTGTEMASFSSISSTNSLLEHLKTFGSDVKSPKASYTPNATDSSLGELLDSLDETKKKRLMDLINSEDPKTGKKKFKIMDMLKVAMIYFVMFVSLRVFFK